MKFIQGIEEVRDAARKAIELPDGVPVANVQETSIRVSKGKVVKENEGLRPRILWTQLPDNFYS